MYFCMQKGAAPRCWRGLAGLSSELGACGIIIASVMGRKKLTKQEALLSRTIVFRVTESEFKRLEDLRRQSNCHAIGEVIRRILQRQPITLFHQDASLDAPLEELARIREELRAIGVNINQVTRHFNGSQRPLLAQQALAQYQRVEAKVGLLLTLISQLAKKW